MPVEQRARELGIKTCLQGHFDKNVILMQEIETREVMGRLDDAAMEKVAKRNGLTFIDLFHPTLARYAKKELPTAPLDHVMRP